MYPVEIITIGDELLIGQVIDTNSAWMAKQLNKVGLPVKCKTTIGDDEQDILDALAQAFSRADIILLTGGIGPTKDDITKKTLCRFFDTQLVFDDNTLSNIEQVLRNISRNINELTRAQAYVPESATIIQNKMGTAPVTWFEKDGKILVSMPGVPYEMKWIMDNEIIPRLTSRFSIHDTIIHQTYWVKDYSESALAMHLEEWESALPKHIRLAYLPTSGLIRLRLSGTGEDKTLLEKEMSSEQTKLVSLLSNHIFSDEDDSLEAILHRLLIDKKLSLGLAESCTGGKLASLFTAMPNSSNYFKGGVVSYSNEAKETILGVRAEDINQYGAVSKTVVEQMALGARRIFNSDCSIATSGIAGPGGGTPVKPVGTVWIAISYKEEVISQEFHFSTNRENNIMRASYSGIRMLLEKVKQ